MGFILSVYVMPWSEFPIAPSYPHYPQRQAGESEEESESEDEDEEDDAE